MAVIEIECKKEDLKHETFLSKAQSDLKRDGISGIGLIKYKCGYLIDELENFGNIRDRICTELICSKYSEDNGLWQIEFLKRFANKKNIAPDFNEIKNYLGCPFINYLDSGSNNQFQSANCGMSDEEINELANYCYENEINEQYKGIYSIFEDSLMRNCSFDLEKIPDRLRECGTTYPGLTTGYVFVGRRGSHSGIHSEDYELPSININFEGKLIFLVQIYILFK